MKRRIWIFILVAIFAAVSFGQAQQGQQNGDKSSQIPPEQAAGQAPFIMGYQVAPGGGQDISNKYPTNADLGYKGVVMANFDSSDANDELFADFGSLGLWFYNNGSWTQVSGVNPDKMIAVTGINIADDELVVDFGSLGLWYWDWGWSQISGVNPTGMFGTDDDGDGADEIQVDFGSLGVWHFDPDTWSWKQLSNLNPYYGLRMDYWTPGYQEGVWNFPTYGMWNMFMQGTSVHYQQLTGTVTSEDDFASADFGVTTTGAEDLVADFASLGLWLYKGDRSGWVQISTMNCNRIKEVKFVGGQDYELLAEENGTRYLYWGNWNGSSFTWIRIGSYDSTAPIGPGFCETFDKDGTDSGDEEVVIPRSTGGADLFDYSAGSTLTLFINTPYFVNFMVKGDYYGVGRDSTMAFVFSASSPQPGLWLYETSHGITKISSSVPDGIY
jgi:hypothetical protein